MRVKFKQGEGLVDRVFEARSTDWQGVAALELTLDGNILIVPADWADGYEPKKETITTTP